LLPYGVILDSISACEPRKRNVQGEIKIVGAMYNVKPGKVQ